MSIASQRLTAYPTVLSISSIFLAHPIHTVSMFNPFIKIKEARRAKAAAKQQANGASDKDKTSQTGSGHLGKNEKFLIQGLSGVLKSGEMALVVGRPGSGCTTFLKVRVVVVSKLRRSRASYLTGCVWPAHLSFFSPVLR